LTVSDYRIRATVRALACRRAAMLHETVVGKSWVLVRALTLRTSYSDS
jgi:hypothetical protein